MDLICPKCHHSLPQIGNEIVRPGDEVQCCLCLHIWKLKSLSAPCPKTCEPLTDRKKSVKNLTLAGGPLNREIVSGIAAMITPNVGTIGDTESAGLRTVTRQPVLDISSPSDVQPDGPRVVTTMRGCQTNEAAKPDGSVVPSQAAGGEK